MRLKSLTPYACAAALAIGALAMPPAMAQGQGEKAPLTAIAVLDLPRYMGTWYEIASFPNPFQKKCTGFTQADYSAQPDGSVQVVNRCRVKGGDMSEAVGSARQLGDANSPRLKVRFAPAWLSFIPFVWGDYWVIDIDQAYQLVAVSEPSREYLWVLSRTATVEAKAYEALLGRLAGKGFDVQKLRLTDQGQAAAPRSP